MAPTIAPQSESAGRLVAELRSARRMDRVDMSPELRVLVHEYALTGRLPRLPC